MTLTTRILIAMIAGIVVGSGFNFLSSNAWLPGAVQGVVDSFLIGGLFDVVGRIFVASLKMLVVPLVFVSLICGASALGNNARMGRIAIRTIALYMLTTAIAVSVALMFAVLVGPGTGVSAPGEAHFVAKEAPPLADVTEDISPKTRATGRKKATIKP